MKKVETTITCDGCGSDISPQDSSYPHQYILRLTVDDIGRNSSGLVYGIAMYPPLSKDAHFCAEQCVLKWAQDQKKTADEIKAKREAQMTEGTVIQSVGGGTFWISDQEPPSQDDGPDDPSGHSSLSGLVAVQRP